MDTVVELQDIPVMKVRANMKGKGPSEAFDLLESRLPTLRGRKFYGAFRMLSSGDEEYYACVERIENDDPDRMQLETGVIPGGKYARRKITGWEKIIREGMLPRIFEEFVKSNEPNVDHDESRPSLEFYRSHEELFLFVPLKKIAGHET
jgi:hypothetical protein